MAIAVAALISPLCALSISLFAARAGQHMILALVAAPLVALGAIYYWFPKMTGRMLDEGLGKWNFWTMFIGFNLAFLPMHITGLRGMPRRIYTYPGGMGWDTLNLITTIGAFVSAVGVLLLLINVMISLRQGRIAGDNPWGAPTPVWSISSRTACPLGG